MKLLKLTYILPILIISLLTTSCSSDDDSDDNKMLNEIEGLTKIQELANATHTIELFNTTGQFKTGYNAIHIRVKDNTTSTYLEHASLSWMPMMQMPTMQHSCPNSEITKVLEKDTVYEGFLVFQMTNTDGSGWSLTVNYTVDDIEYTANSTITVVQNENQNITSFMASDANRYIIAMVEPKDPKIAINNLKVALYKMESMISFPEVTDYKIALDPRMPGMGNHSSPNNTDLSYNTAEKMYHANLSLTMTGYWVLNLKLLNSENEVLKGENVTDDNPQSSLYLELEF